MALLEEKVGRNAVIRLLEDDPDNPITFSEYPRDARWLLEKREQVNRLISGNQ